MEIDAKELAWAAGLFEGEGCITFTRDSRPKYRHLGYIRLTLGMTDEDSVLRFAAAVGCGIIRTKDMTRDTRATKVLYEWRVNNFEQSQAIIAFLWWGLGKRRRARAVEVLNMARRSQGARTNWRRTTGCAMLECMDPVKARGLCNKHYLRAQVKV